MYAQSDLLRALVGALPGHRVGAGGSIRVTESFCPIPDIAVYELDRDEHDPYFRIDEALLVVEVGVSSAFFDRNVKLPAYATGGAIEVWLRDPNAAVLSRHRDPQDGRYRDETFAAWPDGLDRFVADLVEGLAG